jgi:hypothetical protein
MNIVLRILVSSVHELPFVRLNVLESQGKVDRVLICEADYTHTGKPKEFIFSQLIKDMDLGNSKIEYLPMKIQNRIDWTKRDGELYHHIEKVIRHQFSLETSIQANDIVIAVDADEVIYQETYEKIIERMSRKKFFFAKPLRLRLHQFFYKLDYYWHNSEFSSPIATKARYFLNKKEPMQWRDEGDISNFFAGCHFSWIMDLDQMVAKLNNYAHHDIYGKYANHTLLQKAINEKKYPFDNSVDFQIKVVDRINDIYPKNFYKVFGQEHSWFSPK